MVDELPQESQLTEHYLSQDGGFEGIDGFQTDKLAAASTPSARDAFAEAAQNEEEAKIDIAAAVESEIFGNGTVRGLAWVQEAIRSRANFAQRLPDTNLMTIGYGPGSLSNL